MRMTDWDRLQLDRLRRELYDQEEKRRYDPLRSELIQQEVA
jgi:hypothetical protein